MIRDPLHAQDGSSWTRRISTPHLLSRAISVLNVALLFASTAARGADAPPLHALLIGGGPDKHSNAAQIESHVRFVAQLLPAGAKRVVLFADGKPGNATVTYTDSAHVSEAQRAMDVLLPEDSLGEQTRTRAPELGVPIDGPARRNMIRRTFKNLATAAAPSPAPVLLYFAGHGSQDENDASKTRYDLWNREGFTVHDLAAEIARLPANAPVLLVMAQCYSGAFANVIFENGSPDGAPVSRDFAGFFSATQDRQASGCGSGTEAADYQDFSSYFFGALCGHDRLGNPVSGSADYDADGRVSLHEAFCYALIHDESFDTPTCTSDAFLKRFAAMEDSVIYGTPFQKVLETASPAQRAALQALSAQLELSGEDRLLKAYDRLTFNDPVARPKQLRDFRDAQDKLRALRESTLQPLFTRWPALRWRDSAGFSKAAAGALGDLERDSALCRRLLDARSAYDHTDDAFDNEEALLIRFANLCENIVRARQISESGDAALNARFEKLREAEARSWPLQTTAPR